VTMRAPAVHERGGGWVTENASCSELEDLVVEEFRGFRGCYGMGVPRTYRGGAMTPR